MRTIFFFVSAAMMPGFAFAQATGAGPGETVTQIFNFAMAFGGFLAFGMIVYGGVKYVIAAGNSSGQSDAKDQIVQALLGLLLLIGGIFILNVINPEIPKASFGALTKLAEVKDPVAGTQCPSVCGGGQGCVQDPATGNKSCQPCPMAKVASCTATGERCILSNNTFVCGRLCGPDKNGYCENPVHTCNFLAGNAPPYWCAPAGSPPP